MPSARRAARALLLRSTSAVFLRDAHAPVVVQIAICKSERMSTSSPGRASSRAPVSAWQNALSFPLLLVANAILPMASKMLAVRELQHTFAVRNNPCVRRIYTNKRPSFPVKHAHTVRAARYAERVTCAGVLPEHLLPAHGLLLLALSEAVL